MAVKRRAQPQTHGKHYVIGTSIEVERVRVVLNGRARWYWREQYGHRSPYYNSNQVEIREHRV